MKDEETTNTPTSGEPTEPTSEPATDKSGTTGSAKDTKSDGGTASTTSAG
jgi:hypothetical protein